MGGRVWLRRGCAGRATAGSLGKDRKALTPLEPGSRKHGWVSVLKHAASLVGDMSAYEPALSTRHEELSAA